MKRFIIALAILCCCIPGAADYAVLTKEANAARKAKKFELALQKYNAAYQAAKNGREKYNAVKNLGSFLYSCKEKAKAAEVYENALINDDLEPRQRQSLLINIAAMYLWDKQKYQYALDKLNLAFAVKDGFRPDEISYFIMCNYAACIYNTFKKEYDPIIVICEPAAERSKINWHKATLYSAIARAYNKLGKKDEAVKNYELALMYAKKDKGYVRSNGAKALADLEKTLKGLKK